MRYTGRESNFIHITSSFSGPPLLKHFLILVDGYVEEFQWNLLHYADWTKLKQDSEPLRLDWLYRCVLCRCVTFRPVQRWIRITVLGWNRTTSWQSLKFSRASCGPIPPGKNCWRAQNVYRAIVNNRLSIVRFAVGRGVQPRRESDGRTSENGKSERLLPCRGQTPWFSTRAHWRLSCRTWCNDLRQSFEAFQAVKFMSM